MKGKANGPRSTSFILSLSPELGDGIDRSVSHGKPSECAAPVGMAIQVVLLIGAVGRLGIASGSRLRCVVIVLDRWEDLHLTGNHGKRRLATLPGRPAGRQSPRGGAVIVTMGTNSRVRVQTAISHQVAGVVELGGELTVVELLLHQAILDRAVLALELGDRAFQLLVLVFQMAQTGLELANAWSARQEALSSRTTCRHAEYQPDQRQASVTRRPSPATSAVGAPGTRSSKVRVGNKLGRS
jgi:hypothetical protein